MSGSPPSFSDYLYFYSFMDRNVHAHFYRQPISIDCQVLFIFFFSGRLCRNRYCTFLDFQNRFNKVCRIVFRFVHRPLADSFRRNLLQKWQCQCLSGFLRVFQDLKSGAHPYLPYDLAVCSCMDIIYIRFSVTYFLYSFHSAWSFLFSLERALPEKFHFFIEKIIRKSKQGSGKAMNQITQSRDYQLIIRLFVNRIFIFSKF